ncbi:MAG: VTT domain-containing protein [Planctomycetaceae bacterium]|nr:VTT domain-containing protein [Planctomycetaceae bacterium]
MHSTYRLLLILALALAIPILPFILLGDGFEQWLNHWTQQFVTPQSVFVAVVTVLSLDVLLPVPSSAVSTFAGDQLGILGGTLASFLGMTLGACGGFAVARWLGPKLLPRLADAEDLQRLQSFDAKWGLWILLLTRPLPILAEAAVVLLGALRFPWRSFLIAITLSHLVIALLYACWGAWAATANQTGWALAISLIVPVLLTIVVRAALPVTSSASPAVERSVEAASDSTPANRPQTAESPRCTTEKS